MTYLPREAGTVLAVELARASALGSAALGLGAIVDAVTSGESGTRSWLLSGGAVAAAGLLAAVVVLLVSRAEGRQATSWRGRVARALLGGPLVPESQAGASVESMTGAVDQVASYRATFLGPTLGAFLAPLVVLAMIALAVDPALAGVLTLFIALVPVILGAFMRVFRGANVAFRRASARLSAFYLESISAVGMLKVFGAAGRRADDLAKVSERMRVETMALLKRNLLVIIVTDATFGLAMVTVAVGLALRALVAGQITLGDAVAVLMMTLLLVEPVDKLGRSFYVGMIGRTYEERLEGLVQDATVTTDADPVCQVAPQILVRDLVVRHGDRTVVQVERLALPAGKRLALVGPTGAGKTTLALVLQGLIEPDRGEVLIDGRVTTSAERRATVATVSQHTYLFSGSVADNLRLADPDADEDTLWRALGAAHVAEEIAAMPQALGTAVGEGGQSLSGGQARRVSLARALCRDAPVLVLDEPTADLDRHTRGLVDSTLAQMSSNRTVVTVEHRLSGTLSADLVAVIEDGRVTELANPRAARERNAFYARALAEENDTEEVPVR